MSRLIAKNRHFKRLDEHYVKIGNMNILIQPNSDTLTLLEDYLKDTRNQVIHIIELYPVSIQNLLSAICTTVHPDNKIFIHIPHMLKDYVRLIQPEIDALGRKVRFITERKKIVFKYYQYGYPKYFGITFDKDHWNYYIHIYEDVKTYGLAKSQYFVSDDNSIRTVPQRNYPELFREDIINNFKKSNPKGIVEGFSTDDEIWEFLIENGIVHIEDDKEEKYNEEVEVMINGKLEKVKM